MVMKNRRWNREFPQVPYAVHMSVLDALSALEDQEEKKVNRITEITKRDILDLFKNVLEIDDFFCN